MSEKDIDLTVREGVLTISGEKKSETEDRERGWSERYFGRFERRIMLPDGVDEAHCDATFRGGVLTVRMPKSAEAKRSRKIPINGGTRH
jgi:HSP20 family protein